MTTVEDARSLDSIVKALYDVISGPAGERDWERCAALFAPGARLIALRSDEGPRAVARVMTPAEYRDEVTPYFLDNAFHESEVERRVERFGALAHAWSSYESRRNPDEEPFARGVNSIQLFDDGERWWVLSVTWPRMSEPVLGAG